MNRLLDYGFDLSIMPEDIKGIPARVLAVHKDRYELVCDYGKIYGRLKAGIYYAEGMESYPTTGDFVLIQYNEQGDSLITKTLERKSAFSRSDFSGHAAGYVKGIKEQVVAANFDSVFIMASLNDEFKVRRIERYLALGWQSGATPVVILTKSDLVEDWERQVCEVEAIAVGTTVHAVSALTKMGMEALKEYLSPGKTVVFLGSSGVGKSSMVNALAGEEVMTVKSIREDDSRGRHTTTHRQLIRLPNGAMIIDTPGMRELGMWDTTEGLRDAFADVEAYFGQCRFSDCSHRQEPGCALQEAISAGLLASDRWESYVKLEKEARFVENKSVFLQEKERWHKEIAMRSKQLKNKRK